MEIEGRVGTGLGTGKYFMSIPEYKRQFEEILGWEPYAGTLNVYLEDDVVEEIEKLRERAKIIADGFVKDGITFFRVKIYHARIPKYKYSRCAVVFPGDDHGQKNVVQIIAPEHLRTVLALKDGDYIKIEILE